MRESAKTWAERVTAWRESGLTSDKFCDGKKFRPNALRNWAWRLGKTKPRRKFTVPIARVVPTLGTGLGAQVSTPRAPTQTGITVEFGSVRIVVGSGFDRPTMAAVLELLVAVGGAR
jgi:hypothetical protein